MIVRMLRLVSSGLLPAAWHLALRDAYRDARDILKLMSASLQDMTRFMVHGGMLRRHRAAVLEARIIKQYHRIEKGLALARPRAGFGVDAFTELLRELSTYRALHGHGVVVARAVGTAQAYLRLHEQRGWQVPPEARAVADFPLPADEVRVAEAGTTAIDRAQWDAMRERSLDGLFSSRHSIRQFTDQPVDLAVIEHAVRLAQHTPSVCNREAGRVLVVQSKSRIQALLALQNGNRGFGDQASVLLIVTADMRCFVTVGERHQCWIDGGMHAMTLVWALHALGLGTCCLNWSVEPAQDRALRQLAGLGPERAVIMMIAVGHVPESFCVATSARRAARSVLRVDSDTSDLPTKT